MMETSQRATQKRKKEPKNKDIWWAIYEVETESKKVRRLVKPAKGFVSGLEKQRAPVIEVRREEVGNTHALHIMHHLHHNNILRMRGLDENTTENGYVNVHVDPTVGLLATLCDLDNCADRLKHIPSDIFRTFVREIVKGITFLAECGYYHGDLSWENTLYAHPYAVKLSGFKTIDKSVDGWLHDRLSLAKMLQDVSTKAHAAQQYVCDDIDDLIAMLQRPALLSPDIIGHTFFWSTGPRRKFYAANVSLKLKDARFKLMIRHSHLCVLPWKGKNQTFDLFVAGMDKYRAGNYYPDYDQNCPVEFLMCIAGGYTHQHQLENIDVDYIVRRNHPRLCFYLKRLVDQFDSSGFSCNDRACKICHPPPPEQLPRHNEVGERRSNRGGRGSRFSPGRSGRGRPPQGGGRSRHSFS